MTNELEPTVGVRPRGTWVQTERAAHEAWAKLLRDSPRAAELLHLLVARVGNHNAVVVSQKTLAALMGRHVNTVQKAVRELKAGGWLDVRQIGDRGTVNIYVLGQHVVWYGKRDGKRYSIHSSNVILSEAEQPDSIDYQEPLRPVPRVYSGEQQLPTGDGLPPPSEPSLPGLEPDLPTRKHSS